MFLTLYYLIENDQEYIKAKCAIFFYLFLKVLQENLWFVFFLIQLVVHTIFIFQILDRILLSKTSI